MGQQPVIFPKTGFEYSSACPLSTPNGRMVTPQKFLQKSLDNSLLLCLALPFSIPRKRIK